MHVDHTLAACIAVHARRVPFALAAMCVTSLACAAQEEPAWTTQGPKVDEETFAFELPLAVVANKLFVDIELGGAMRRFLFDTGSPSMMSATLADALRLEPVARRQSRDAHGAVVDTAIVQADLVLGGVTFRRLPVYVADFPHTARCLFDGVLGSELLPLCAWQIDLPDGALRCHSRLSTLAHVDGAHKIALYDFGYPHAPIVDVRFADDARSKALFDTGSPDHFTLSPPDFEGARRSGAVTGTTRGHGSLGGSIGGPAPRKEQSRAQLRSLGLGGVDLGRVDAAVRASPPSLVGAAVLDHFVVTLDAAGAAAYFDRYRDGPFARGSYGFGLSFEDAPVVSLVWEDSPAEAAGLRVG